MANLSLAADPDRYEAACRLVARGANGDVKDEEGKTPLHIATSVNNTRVVDLLTDEAKADVNAQDKEKKSSLLIALDRKFEALSEKLLLKGANAQISDTKGLVNTEN